MVDPHLGRAGSTDPTLPALWLSQHFFLQALLRPELLGKEFTHLEFPRRIQPKELGKKMLYRDQNMNGW